MLISKKQQGIGLIEVLVSLMLLAIAVLGFSAMQMTAVKATDESVIRSRALTVMRGGAETMRANPSGITAFTTALNQSATTLNGITKNSCVNGTSQCNITQLATRDALALKDFATQNDIKISAVNCPNAGTLTCLVAAWGETQATLGSGANACATADGTYNVGSSCFIMEAY